MKRGGRNALQIASSSYKAVMRSEWVWVLVPPVLDAVILME
jgi:hypothetical protein